MTGSLSAFLAVASSPVDNADKQLVELARQKFGELTRAEEKLFDAAVSGRFASELAEDDAKDDPTHVDNWDAQRVLRADRI